MTDEMLTLARANAAKAGAENVGPPRLLTPYPDAVPRQRTANG